MSDPGYTNTPQISEAIQQNLEIIFEPPTESSGFVHLIVEFVTDETSSVPYDEASIPLSLPYRGAEGGAADRGPSPRAAWTFFDHPNRWLGQGQMHQPHQGSSYEASRPASSSPQQATVLRNSPVSSLKSDMHHFTLSTPISPPLEKKATVVDDGKSPSEAHTARHRLAVLSQPKSQLASRCHESQRQSNTTKRLDSNPQGQNGQKSNGRGNLMGLVSDKRVVRRGVSNNNGNNSSKASTKREPLSPRRLPLIVGRPLWSGNFSGANAPRQHSENNVVRPSLGSARGLIAPDRSLDPVPEIDSKSVPTKPPRQNEGQAPAAPQTTSIASISGAPAIPVVHYNNYNYRPVLVQSPQCASNAVQIDRTSCTAGSTTSSSAAALFADAISLAHRQRSTSTAECITCK